MSGDHDLWYVKTADGDVDRMTLDQLDEAFNAGHIDENVTVLPAGQNNWVRLGTLLGLDQPATPPPVSFAPVPRYAPVPNSMRPVSFDLSDDLEFPELHKKSRKAIGIVAIAAVLLIPAGILGANRMHLGSLGSTPNVAAAAMQAPPPVTAAPPPPAPVPPPPATTATATADNRFSDEQKAKLAAADKALDAKIKAKQKARVSGGGHHASQKYKAQGFTSGGNKYDPLNSGI
jgi:hypothetical protein